MADLFPSPPPFPTTWTWPSSCQETYWTGQCSTGRCDIYQIYTTESTSSYSCLPPGYLTTTNGQAWYGTWGPASCPTGFTTATASTYSVRSSSVSVTICCASGYTYNPGALSCGSSYTTSLTVSAITSKGQPTTLTEVGPGQKHMQAYTLWSTFGQAVVRNSATTGSASAVPAGGSGGGLSTGAKAGIAVGVVIGVLLVLSGALFFLFRRRRASKESHTSNPDIHEMHEDSARHELDSKQHSGKHELAGSEKYSKPNPPDLKHKHPGEYELAGTEQKPYRSELNADPKIEKTNVHELGATEPDHTKTTTSPVAESASSPYYEQSRALPIDSHLPVHETHVLSSPTGNEGQDPQMDIELRRLEEEEARIKERRAELLARKGG